MVDIKRIMFGYDDKRLADSVRQMILSGQAEIPQKLFEVDIPKKGTEKLRRSLQSSELWELHGDTVYNVFGVAFQGIASWGVGLTVRLAGRDYRFKVLHLDRFGKRMVYLLPAAQISNLSVLPQIDLSHDEGKLILQMAEDLSKSTGCQEYFMVIKNPVAGTIAQQAADWRKQPYEERELLALLSQNHILWEAAVTALDAQLHSFKKLWHSPQGITNFVLPGGDAEAGA